MSRRQLLTVALLSMSSAAGAETNGLPDYKPIGHTAEPVIGGTAVPPGKWPDAVAVLGAQGSCTGTLIAPDVVLTAGHCADANPTRVIANTTNFNAAGGTTAMVQSITAYPGWENSYDVAVIVLQTPITGIAPRKVGTACTFQDFTMNTPVHLVGFGSTDIQGGGNNTRLNEATAPVTDPMCATGNGCVASIAPGGEFIAGGAGKDSCFGDSGGPVYLDTARGTMVVGAVSRGLDGSPTPCGGGGIYVRTDKVVQWIETTTGKQIAKDDCQVTPPDDDGTGMGSGSGSGSGNGGGGRDDEAQTDVIGGCTAAGGAGSGMIALGILLAARRRRRAWRR